jgi:hypothetical protein
MITMSTNGLDIDITADRVQISVDDEVLACWTADEWEADPSIVPSIANGVFLALTNLPALKKAVSMTLTPT